MLFLHEKLTVTSSRQRDAIERVRWIHSYMRKHPGFARARIARYLGNPSDYLVLRWWRSADDLAEHQKNPELPNWGANRPEGLYLAPPRTTRWESAGTAGWLKVKFLVRSIYRGASPAASDSAGQVLECFKSAMDKGLLAYGEVFTPTEGDGQGALLTLAGFEDRDGFNVFLAGPASERLERSLADGELEIAEAGCYEIVEEEEPAG